MKLCLNMSCIDIFEQYDLRKHCKDDTSITSHMDRKLKCTVYRLTGPVPSSVYLSLSDMSISSRYLYIIFQPLSAQYFIIHLRAVSRSNKHKFRLSISNLFHELKVSSSVIMIPYAFDEDMRGIMGTNGPATPTPDHTQWTILSLDISLILQEYFGCNDGHMITSIRLCANMLIKGCYTSDTLHGVNELPHDMRLPVPKGLMFDDIYHHIMFPSPCQWQDDPPTGHTSIHVVTTDHQQGVVADDVMKCIRIVGMGVASASQIAFSSLGSRVFYACHCVVVAMEIKSSTQHFYIGHTNEVSSIALSGDDMTMASSELVGVVRIWDVATTDCLKVFKTSHDIINCLSLSYSGDVLNCIGRHHTGKTLMTIWKNGEQRIKSVTDVDINVMRMAGFNSTRFITCGWNNIRFWRITNSNTIKSSPVNLESYRPTLFTDIQYPNHYTHRPSTDKHIYASTNNGYVFEVHYSTFSIMRVWQLFPEASGRIGITGLALHEAFVATVTDDGICRVWPKDFQHVVMETNHGNPLVAVGVAKHGFQIFTATQSHVGMLDATSKIYKTLLRSHTQPVTGMSLSPDNRSLATVSDDKTIRIWSTSNYEQSHEFISDGDVPTCIDFHPLADVIGVGYRGGSVRCINMTNGSVIAEHSHYRGSVLDVRFTTNGQRLFSSGTCGTLSVHDSSHQSCPVLKLLGNTVTSGKLALNDDGSILGYIGPLESLVTLMSTTSLEQMMRYDITMNGGDPSHIPLTILITSDVIGNVLIMTSHHKILKYSITTGQLITSMGCTDCTCMAIDGRNVIIGKSNGLIEVLDYHNMGSHCQDYHNMDSHCQTFVSHCGAISDVIVSCDHIITSSVNYLHIWNKTIDRVLLTPPTATFSVHVDNNISNTVPRPTTTVPRPTTTVPRPTTTVPCPTTTVPRPTTTVPPPCTNIHSPLDSIDDSLSHVVDGATPINCHDCPVITKSSRRFCYSPPPQTKPNQLFIAPPNQSGIELCRVIGFNQSARNNIHLFKGQLLYTSGSVIVIQKLSDSSQTLLTGHTTEISIIAIEHTGCGFASASPAHDDWCGEIRIWDLTSSKCYKTLDYHRGSVVGLCYSVDDRFMLSIGSDDHVLVIWSAADYSPLIATQLESYINDVYWDPTVPYEFTTVGGAGIQFWILDDINNQLQLHQPQLPLATDECTVVCYSMNRYVYIGCVDGLVSVWSTTSNTCHFQWKTGCHDITSMCCNNERLVVGGANGIIQCWSINPSLSKLVAILETSLQVVGGAHSTSFDKSLDYGVVGGASVYYIDWMNGSYHDILHHHHGNVSALCYSLDGRVMASCDVSGSLIVWDAVTWQSVTQFTTRNTSCTALAMIDRGGGAGQRQLMYVCGYSDGTIRVFDRHKVIHKVKVHQSSINKLMGIADGSGVLCGCGDGVAIAIDIFKGGLIMCKISSHYGSSITDIDVKTFHAALPGTISANEEVWLIASNDQRVSLWNNGVLLDWLTFPTVRYKTAHDESSVMSPSLARFSPTQHDQIIYTGHTVDPCIQIYSISQKIIIRKLPLNYWATCMGLSMGGDVIALGSSNQVLTLMDVEGTFQESSTHCHTLSSLAFSPTCHQLVSTSQNYFHIWKL